jgi:hypothetical protein
VLLLGRYVPIPEAAGTQDDARITMCEYTNARKKNARIRMMDAGILA